MVPVLLGPPEIRVDIENVGVELARGHLWARREVQLGRVFRQRGNVANEQFKQILQSPEIQISTYGNAAIGKIRFMRAALSTNETLKKRVKHWRNYRVFLRCLIVIVDDLREGRARDMAIRRDYSTLEQHERDGLVLKAAFAELRLAGVRYVFSGPDLKEAYLSPCVEVLRRMRIVDVTKALQAAPGEEKSDFRRSRPSAK